MGFPLKTMVLVFIINNSRGILLLVVFHFPGIYTMSPQNHKKIQVLAT